MRVIGFALVASLTLSACVQTRQYADLQFTPPQGDYKLIVMRPDVSVGSVTTGGMVEPRADWTETARANIIAAMKAQQAGRGGNVLVLERRDSLATVSADKVAELERLHGAVGNSIALHKDLGAASDKRRRGLDNLSADAVRFGRPRYDYALSCMRTICSTGRVALGVLGLAGCFIGFCAPMGGGGQFAYASLVDLKTGEVVWFNVLQTGSQVAGITFGDIREPEGAAQMVERLLGRMKPGRDIRRAMDAKQ